MNYEAIAYAVEHAADDDLVSKNLPLARSFASRLHRQFPVLDFEEIESCCYLALCRCAKVFDAGRGYRISAPLWTACRNAVIETIATNSEAHLPKATFRYAKAMLDYRDQHGVMPASEELDKMFGRTIPMTEERYRELRQACTLLERPFYLDACSRANENDFDIEHDARLDLTELEPHPEEPPSSAPRPERKCAVCETRFIPSSRIAKYCSAECRLQAVRKRDRERRQQKRLVEVQTQV